MKARVQTLIVQEIEVPEGTDKQDVFNFLAEHQSFRDAFAGVSTDAGAFRITDIEVIDEEVIELGDEAFDQWIGNTKNI
jgi:hypothetical protein